MALTGVPPEQRPLFGSSRGLPWWGSLLLAAGLAVVAGVAETQFSGTTGRVFEGAAFIGCVAAVCLARRNSLFCPMVQPPLIIGILGPVLTFLLTDAQGGFQSKLLAVANPLINSFPAMAVTTAITLAIGIARIVQARRRGSGSRQVRSRSGAQRPGARKQASQPKPAPSRSAKTGTRSAARPATERGSASRKPSPSARSTRGDAPRTGQSRGTSAKNPPARGGGKPRSTGERRPNPERKPRRRPDDE